MAAVGSEVTGSWFLSSGVVSFFILLFLLSIFLTALCSECSRRSFELRDPEANKDPSALIRVVKLEEVARENPMISEIQNDEKEFNPDEGNVPFTPWRSHLVAPQHQDVQTNGSAAVMTGSDPGDSAHIYHTIGGLRSSGDASLQPTNHEPGDESGAADLSERDRNSVYARVSKKVREATPPDVTPDGQVEDEQDEQDEQDESSPPLPDRKTTEE